MWMMTTRGFFSAVEKWGDQKDGMVTVRARNKEDIDNLADVLPDAVPFQEKFFTDYPWRVRVPKSDWALACARLAMDISYSNFKDEIKKVQGQDRARTYGSIWYALLDLEEGRASDGFWDDDYKPATTTTTRTKKSSAKPAVTPNAKKRPRRKKASTPRSRQTAKRQPTRRPAGKKAA